MILFVDDEKRQLDSHAMELSMVGHTVLFEDNIEGALKQLEENQGAIDLMILDIMMPRGVFSQNETERGLRTGISFYDLVRQKYPKLPVIIFTNVSDPKVSEDLSKRENCLFLRKEEYLPFEFAEQVEKVLSRR